MCLRSCTTLLSTLCLVQSVNISRTRIASLRVKAIVTIISLFCKTVRINNIARNRISTIVTKIHQIRMIIIVMMLTIIVMIIVVFLHAVTYLSIYHRAYLLHLVLLMIKNLLLNNLLLYHLISNNASRHTASNARRWSCIVPSSTATSASCNTTR